MLYFLLPIVLAKTPSGWENIGVTDSISVARKKIEGRNVFAFRGETTTDVPVSQLLAVLSDETLSPKWVDMMISSDVIKTYPSGDTVLHQKYDVPWPLDDRDYVFQKSVSIDQKAKKVIVRLQSADESLAPPTDDYIRAEGERTFWSFEVLPNGQTSVIVEVMTDPKGSMPDWLVNSVQQDWPHKSITALLQFTTSTSPTPHPKCAGWQ